MIPEELMQWNQFLNWKPVFEDGSLRKPPFNPKTLQRCNMNDKSNWSDYKTAKQNKEKGFDISFAVDKKCPFVFSDLDNCIRSNIITEEAMEIIKALDSYTEISPSGKGIRIIAKTYDKESLVPVKTKLVEIYPYGRHMTITGNMIGDRTTIEWRTKELTALVEKHRVKKEGLVERPEVKHTYMSEATLLEKAMNAANGDKFQALWNGEWSAYSSQSNADLALMGMLAFWTGGNSSMMESLFSQSALGRRDKWKRRDYRFRTINAAIANTTRFYGSGF